MIKPTNSGPQAVTAEQLKECLRSRLHGYDGLDGSGKELVLVREIPRRFCKLFLFHLASPGDRSQRPTLVVKTPLRCNNDELKKVGRTSAGVSRPRLYEPADPATKPAREYAALRRMQMHFAEQDEPRFGFVPVYDLLPELQAVVMGWVDQPSLRKCLYAGHRFSHAQRTRRCERAFVHAGAWLRSYHALPPLADVKRRNTSRDDYLLTIERYVAYLFDHDKDRDQINQIYDRILQLADEHLPSVICSAQLHGDFAPRNIFIDQHSRVAVFDTLGRFEAPIYEDLAKMLIGIHACGPQMLSRGLLYDPEQLSRYERGFLEGYFVDQPIPLSTIRLFSAQLLLEYWAAIVFQHEEQRGLKRYAKGVRRDIWRRGLYAYLHGVLTPQDDTSSFSHAVD